MTTRKIHSTMCLLNICLLLMSALTWAGDYPLRVLLEADFDDHPLDQQIGTGGAELGEPARLSAGLLAIVRATPRPTPSLEFGHTGFGLVRYADFEFLDDEEVSEGDLMIRLVFRATQADFYSIKVDQGFASSIVFLQLMPTLNIVASDAGGSAGTIGSYAVQADHVLIMKFHMDAGTYDIELDAVPLLTARSYGFVTGGIAGLSVGITPSTAQSSLFYVDRIRVVHASERIYSDGFEG